MQESKCTNIDTPMNVKAALGSSTFETYLPSTLENQLLNVSHSMSLQKVGKRCSVENLLPAMVIKLANKHFTVSIRFECHFRST